MSIYVIVITQDDLRSASASPWDGIFEASKPEPSEQAQPDQQDERSSASPPLDTDARRALFASLRDVYGDLDDDERLHKVSILAGRKIYSMSRYGNMTMADASRVLDILHTFQDF